MHISYICMHDGADAWMTDNDIFTPNNNWRVIDWFINWCLQFQMKADSSCPLINKKFMQIIKARTSGGI